MSKQLSSAAAALGRKGGKQTLKKHGQSFFQKNARKGAKARWANRRHRNSDPAGGGRSRADNDGDER